MAEISRILGRLGSPYPLEYDIVVRATGWEHDMSVYHPSARPILQPSGRFPVLSADYQAANVPGLYFAGMQSHAKDHKKAAGGFEMVPMLANYRPSGTTSRPTSQSSENRAGTSPGSPAAVVLANDGATPHDLTDTTQAKKEGHSGTATVPVASGFGFSMDIFLD